MQKLKVIHELDFNVFDRIMNTFNYYKILLQLVGVIPFLFACSDAEQGKSNNNTKQVNICPCDTMLVRQNNPNDSDTLECYRKNKIKISIVYKAKQNNDTIEVTRYYEMNRRWRVQEYLVLLNDKIIEDQLAMYCDFKDTVLYNKITFIKDESWNRGRPEVETTGFSGVDVVIHHKERSKLNDTLRSKDYSILIPKEIFLDTLEVIKHTKIYNRKIKEEGVRSMSMFFLAEDFIKYGSLYNQYLLIIKNCNVNLPIKNIK